MSKHHVNVLERARDSIAREIDILICYSLSLAAHSKRERDAARELQAVIAERLGHHVTYYRWMSRTHPDEFDRARRNCTLNARLKEGRLAWIDSLIEEFKDK